jgi:hypothetical protein
MIDLATLADQHQCRAQEMRTIARRISDQNDRGSLIEFIDSYERMARALKAWDHGVTRPSLR